MRCQQDARMAFGSARACSITVTHDRFLHPAVIPPAQALWTFRCESIAVVMVKSIDRLQQLCKTHEHTSRPLRPPGCPKPDYQQSG